MESVNLALILAAAFVATASPGPATLAIIGTSLASGRKFGLAVASGVTTGSFVWSVGGALGLSAVMLANAWVFEVLRFAGALYLGWLAVKVARSAISPKRAAPAQVAATSLGRAYVKGLSLHLTNPKAILFFGSLYSIGVPPNVSPDALLLVICSVGLQSFVLFHSYALLFSLTTVARRYERLRRWFDAAFALAFGAASFRILTARLR